MNLQSPLLDAAPALQRASGEAAPRSDEGSLSPSTVGRAMAAEDAHRLALAQRLHRDVSGGLAVCTTMLEMARFSFEHSGDAKALMENLDKLEQSIRQAAGVVREVTEEQYPLALKAFGLNFALEKFCQALSSDTKSSVSLSSQGGEFALPLEQRFGVYEMVAGLARRCVTAGGATVLSIQGGHQSATLEFLFVHDGADDLCTVASPDDVDWAALKARTAFYSARLLTSCSTEEGASSFRLVVPIPAKPATPSIGPRHNP